jgi:hypothetical protein
VDRIGPDWPGLARRAEDLGYSTLFTTDHYFGPGDISTVSGHRPVDLAPLTAMTAAAMATTGLRVGCRVFCVDYQQRVREARGEQRGELDPGGRGRPVRLYRTGDRGVLHRDQFGYF